MSNHVVIVESPAKAKTIGKYLGKSYKVLASYGHVRDLPAKKGSVEPDNNFSMTYAPIEKNAKHVKKIADSLKKADSLILATDPDREGEAISWHIYELLKDSKVIDEKPVSRVVFHEITKSAIKNAIDSPREISMDLVNAQQARRALDYLVGFNLSPLLWKKVQRGLSAGRVQSPALRMIVEREEAIEKFQAQEYWTIEADVTHKKAKFVAKLLYHDGTKIEQFTINNEKQAKKITDDCLKNANGVLKVSKVEKKQRKRNPSAPFITSTLQQEAARKLGFSAQKTMRVAQQLYEGIETTDDGLVGLITYMRTDSVSLAKEAIESIRETIQNQYGKDSLPDSVRQYKTKAKNAQEAHEAIRPTDASLLPKNIKTALSADQFKLYELIWKRTIASQMIHATINSVVVEFECGHDKIIFKATGSTIATPGFIQVYQEGLDDAKDTDDKQTMLPELKQGDEVKLDGIRPEQHFTEPPPRYSEASLVKALEEFGIGRPSTYASIISTLIQRGYAKLDKKRFIPSDVARVVNKFLTQHFQKYVDYGFTASLEDELDAISRGEKAWIPLLQDFWQPFNHQVQDIEENVKRSDVTSEQLDENCPKCDSPIAIRLGKRGRFIGCTTYPDCDYTRSLNEEENQEEPEKLDRNCPKCESELVVKFGRYGKFIGCSGYPDCKHMEPLEKPKETGVSCPECKKGQMLERKSRRGKVFFSCDTYPKCKYAVWNEPVSEACSKCKWPILTIKTTKRRGTEKVCPQKECDFVEQIEPPEKS